MTLVFGKLSLKCMDRTTHILIAVFVPQILLYVPQDSSITSANITVLISSFMYHMQDVSIMGIRYSSLSIINIDIPI